MSKNESLLSDTENAWPLQIFECLSFQPVSCFPSFFPQALLCPNALIGKNYSLLHDEEPICCEMGPTGICLCLLTLPLGPYTPLGGMGVHCCFANYYRNVLETKFSLKKGAGAGKGVCCLIPNQNDCCDFLYYGMFHPCSNHQVYATIKVLNSQKNNIGRESTYSNPIQ